MTTTTRIFGVEDMHRAVATIGRDQLMDRLIARMQLAFETYDAQTIHVPVRDGFNYELPRTGLVEWMPVMALGRCALMKLVCYHPENPSAVGLPTILSSFCLIDTETGHMIAISDGTFLTALRTGAASAIATRALADPNARTVGIIGCGAQAVTQLHALSRVMPIDLVMYWDIDKATRDNFSERVGDCLPPGTRLRETPIDMLVANVDVLCTATSISVNEGPLFVEGTTRESLHINAVGSDFPGKYEVPKSLLQRSTVIPDFLGQAMAEGECQQLDAESVGPELYVILQNRSHSELKTSRTVFDSTGWAVEDLVAMELMVDCGEELGLGRELQFESIPLDPKNPYLLTNDEDSLAHGTRRHK